jgi:hypothetical protein
MEKLMPGSDQCYGQIGSWPLALICGRLSDWLLSGYTEASSVFQEDERLQTDAAAKKPIFRKDRVQTKG